MAMTHRLFHRWAFAGVALLLLCGGGCVQLKHYMHWHNPMNGHHKSPWYHCPDCGRILTDPKHHECRGPYFVEYPFYGYSATCWRPWPAGWIGCPVQIEEIEVIEGTYLPEQMMPTPVEPPPSPPMPREQRDLPPRDSRRSRPGPLAEHALPANPADAHASRTSPIILMAMRSAEIVGQTTPLRTALPQQGAMPPAPQAAESYSAASEHNQRIVEYVQRHQWPMVAAAAPPVASQHPQRTAAKPSPAPRPAEPQQPTPAAAEQSVVTALAETPVPESPKEDSAEDRTGDTRRGLTPVQIRLVSGAEETP